MAVMAMLTKRSFSCKWVFSLLLIILWVPIPAESGPIIRRRMVRCRSIKYIRCYLFWQFCPLECPTSCVMDCVSCKPVCSCNYPGAVCQDPRFVGGDGITFYFHGRKDRDFCLVSDHNLHINAHFIGKRNMNMKRDFTWVQSIGIMFHTHQLLVAAKKTTTWDNKVDHLELAFDGMPISLSTREGAKWQESAIAPRVLIKRTLDTNGITVEAPGNFKVTAVVVPITEEESRVHGYNITEDNCFAHLELGFKFYNLTDYVHGVLGQTYRKDYVSKAKVGASMSVLGGDHKFSSSHLFATDCIASQFGGHALTGDGAAEYGSLQCNSGMKGAGVAC